MMTLLEEDESKRQVELLLMPAEEIHSQETAQIPQFSAQSRNVTGDNPGSTAFAVIEKPVIENLFDLSLLEEMDDNEYVSDILTIYLGSTPKDLYELKSACISNKFDTVYKMTHKLKGSTGLLQASFLLTVLNKIEESARAKKNDELVELAALAIEEYKKIEVPLKQHLRNIQSGLKAAIKKGH